MSESRRELLKSLCASVSLPLPDIPKLTKYENHDVTQTHCLFTADTEGKNCRRTVGKKKQNRTKPPNTFSVYRCHALQQFSFLNGSEYN